MSTITETATETPVSEDRSLKMRELEQETGVGRETIRFYIREGLLPEPERPKRNVARYAQIHVDRLKAIKKLQHERFLPLNVIKTIMNAQDADVTGSFVGLEHSLYPLLGDPKKLEPRKLADVAADAGVTVSDVEEAISLGFVRADMRDGEFWLDGRNARIVSLWRELKDAGFTEELGYTADRWRIYAQFVDWLVREEVTTFYKNLADRVGQAEAANLASEGVRIMNEMLPLMRTDRVLRAVAEISERGELPGTSEGDGSDE